MTRLFFLICLLYVAATTLIAQKILTPTFHTEHNPLDSTAKRWTFVGGFGTDLSAISLLNPRLSDGESNVNMGGLLNLAVNYQGKRIIWNNRANVQVNTVYNGDEGWTKASDAVLWNTQIGLKVKNAWYAALMMDVQTQVLPTYEQKYLTSAQHTRALSARFFAPATLKVAPGLLYKPAPTFGVMLSAVSNKNIIVTDPTLAATIDSTQNVPLFGNSLGKQWTSQLGAELRADLNLSIVPEKVAFNSVLDLYSNYLQAPENIAIEWLNSIDILLNKYLSLNMRSDWYYDDAVLVKINGNINDLGKRVSIRNTIFLKYNFVF